MPAPRELSQQITPRAKARMQKPQGGGKFWVQIPGGARGEIVMDEIDTCINKSIVEAEICQLSSRGGGYSLTFKTGMLMCLFGV